jgi:regulator of sigma E protease
MFEFLSFLLIVFALSLLIIIHELGHFLAAKHFGVLVEEFGLGYPPRAWGKKIKETLYSINWLPFGGFVKIYGMLHQEEQPKIPIIRSFSHQNVARRFLIAIAGISMNFLLGWFLASLVFAIGIPTMLLITEVKEEGIAAAAGLQKGDQLPDFTAVSELTQFLNKNKGKEILLNVRRNSEKFLVKITPRVEVPEGEGNLGIFLIEAGVPKTNIFKSIGRGFIASINVMISVFLGIIDLIIGVFTDISVLEKFIGPVGIVNVAIQTTRLGFAHFVQLLAMISLNLAVLNIFPIPSLDGSKLLFLSLEKIKGKPINPKTEIIINSVGFAFLFLLISIITVKDILTLL